TSSPANGVFRKCTSEPCIVLLNRINSRLGTLAILRAGAARNPNRSHNLAVADERNAALNRRCALQSENAQTVPACRQCILERLRRPLEQGSGAGLVNRDVGASELGIVHLLVINQITCGV